MESITKDKHSFPWSYILIFLLFSAAIITAGIISYNILYNRATEDKKQELSSILKLKTRQIQDWRNERFGEARFLFNNDLLKKQLYDYKRRPIEKTASNINTFLSTIKENHYHTIIIYDTSGREIYRLGEYLKPQSPMEVYKSIDSGSFRMTDLKYNEEKKFISIELFVPIFMNNRDSTSIIAVMMLLIDPNKDLYPIISAWPSNTKTSETVLVRQEGDSILILNNLNYRKNSAMRFKLPLDKKLPSTMAIKGHQGIIEGTDYRGEKVLFASGSIPETNWHIVVKIDQSEVYESIYVTSALIGVIVLTLLIATGTGIALNARKKEYSAIQNLYQKEQEKLAIKEHYEHLMKQANDIILLLEYTGKIIDANEKALEVYQYSLDELLSMNISDLRKPAIRDRIKNILQFVGYDGIIYESVHCTKNGFELQVEVSSRALEINGSKYIQSIIRDISDRKQNEARIRRLNHVYAVLSEVNQIIVKTKNPDSLFAKICEIAVTSGDFKAAAFGYYEESKKIRLTASSPGTREYFSNMNLTLGPDSNEEGTLNIFFQDGEYFVCNNLNESQLDEEWKRNALSRNYNSFGVFPVSRSNRVIGVLLFFSEEVNFFTGEEVKLLTDVSNDISYALQMMDHEKKRTLAEQELRRNELLLKTLAGNMPDTNVLMYNRNLEISIAEGSELGVFKADKQSLKGKKISSLFPIEHRLNDKFLQVFDDRNYEDEVKFGERVYLLKIHPIKSETGEISLGIAVLQNISSRIKYEEAIKESQSKLSGFFNLNNMYMAVVELRGDEIYFNMPNRKLASLYNMSPEELSKHSLRELSGDDVHFYWLDIYKGIWKFKRPVSIEFSTKKDGHTIWLLAEICSIESKENPLFSYSAFDITDRKI